LVCDARCMYATGPDCNCPCGGIGHGAGFRCDTFSQKEIPL
jgi:hypothetical protein